MITDEKRAFPRIKTKIKIKYCLSKKDSIPKEALTENISLGGAYFVAFDSYCVGDVINCWIQLGPKEKVEQVAARVVRCESFAGKVIKTYGVAVEFSNLPRDVEKKISLLKNVQK